MFWLRTWAAWNISNFRGTSAPKISLKIPASLQQLSAKKRVVMSSAMFASEWHIRWSSEDRYWRCCFIYQHLGRKTVEGYLNIFRSVIPVTIVCRSGAFSRTSSRQGFSWSKDFVSAKAKVMIMPSSFMTNRAAWNCSDFLPADAVLILTSLLK